MNISNLGTYFESLPLEVLHNYADLLFKIIQKKHSILFIDYNHNTNHNISSQVNTEQNNKDNTLLSVPTNAQATIDEQVFLPGQWVQFNISALALDNAQSNPLLSMNKHLNVEESLRLLSTADIMMKIVFRCESALFLYNKLLKIGIALPTLMVSMYCGYKSSMRMIVTDTQLSIMQLSSDPLDRAKFAYIKDLFYASLFKTNFDNFLKQSAGAAGSKQQLNVYLANLQRKVNESMTMPTSSNNKGNESTETVLQNDDSTTAVFKQRNISSSLISDNNTSKIQTNNDATNNLGVPTQCNYIQSSSDDVSSFVGDLLSPHITTSTSAIKNRTHTVHTTEEVAAVVAMSSSGDNKRQKTEPLSAVSKLDQWYMGRESNRSNYDIVTSSNNTNNNTSGMNVNNNNTNSSDYGKQPNISSMDTNGSYNEGHHQQRRHIFSTIMSSSNSDASTLDNYVNIAPLPGIHTINTSSLFTASGMHGGMQRSSQFAVVSNNQFRDDTNSNSQLNANRVGYSQEQLTLFRQQLLASPLTTSATAAIDTTEVDILSSQIPESVSVPLNIKYECDDKVLYWDEEAVC